MNQNRKKESHSCFSILIQTLYRKNHVLHLSDVITVKLALKEKQISKDMKLLSILDLGTSVLHVDKI